MSQRLLGGCLLVAALLVAAIPYGRIVGRAIAIEPRTVPVVGACLSRSDVAAAVSTGNAITIDPMGPVFGPCNGTVAGEIVAVWSAPDDPSTTKSFAATAHSQCWRQAARYVGLDAANNSLVPPAPAPADEHVTRKAIRWRLQADLYVQMFVADPVSQRIHRGWVACTVTPRSKVTYTGRVRNAFAGGELPAVYANCQATTDHGSPATPCSSPHQAESFAHGDATGTSEADLAQSCAHLAAGVMRHHDPTVEGNLMVLAHRQTTRPGDSYWPSTPATCKVATVGDRLLNDTVVGLGSHALPFSG